MAGNGDIGGGSPVFVKYRFRRGGKETGRAHGSDQHCKGKVFRVRLPRGYREVSKTRIDVPIRRGTCIRIEWD